MNDNALNQTAPEMPTDLHKLYRLHKEAGLTKAVTLQPLEAQCIAASLRGLQSINAIATAAFNDEAITLSEWLQSGMCEAIGELAKRAEATLMAASDRAADKEAAP